MSNSTLAHHGVKGMHWGVRNDDAVLARISGMKMAGETKEDRQRYKNYKNSTPRAERKKDKHDAINAKIQQVIETSQKYPSNFVKVGTPGYPTLMQGKEFIDYLSRGGYFNPLLTDVTPLEAGPQKK